MQKKLTGKAVYETKFGDKIGGDFRGRVLLGSLKASFL